MGSSAVKSMLDMLPDELIIEILWVARALDVTRMRSTCRRVKGIIDSSTLLQYLIELHRDGFVPFPCSPREFIVKILPTNGDDADENSNHKRLDTHTSDAIHPDSSMMSPSITLHSTTASIAPKARIKGNAVDLLNNLVYRRKRWSDFHLYPPRRCPPDDSQFRLYEFCGGYLAHCRVGEQTDSIIFQNLSTAGMEFRDNGNANGQQELKIPVKCADFTFDLAQDLLVVVEARARLFPLHILCASTGTAHPNARKPYYDDLLLSREIPTDQADSTDIDVELTISGSTVAIGYYPTLNNVISLHVVALDWKKGFCFVNHDFAGAGSVTLLSPTVMAVIHCSSSMIFPEIRLFNLVNSSSTSFLSYSYSGPSFRPNLSHSFNGMEDDYADNLLINPEPTVILTLPHFKPTGTIPSKMTYHSAFFLCGSGLSTEDYQDYQDFGEPNVARSTSGSVLNTHFYHHCDTTDIKNGQSNPSGIASNDGGGASRKAVGSQCRRSGEEDIVPIVLRMTRETHADPHYRIYLFVSKKFLVDCVTERVKKIRERQERREIERKESWEKIQAEKGRSVKLDLKQGLDTIGESSSLQQPNSTTTSSTDRLTLRRASTPPPNSLRSPSYSSTPSREPTLPTPANPYSHVNKSIPMLPPLKPVTPQVIYYKNWGKKHTRWINGTDLRSVSRCSSHGSRFAFVVDPVVGVDPSTFLPILCIFDFNARAWDSYVDGPCVPWDDPSIDATYYQDGLLAGLTEDVTNGMYLKVRIFRKLSARHWKDVMIDRDHVVVRLLSGFEIYTI